jgi:dienelactone hydrolase
VATISRRTALLGAVGVLGVGTGGWAAVEAGVLPGQSRIATWITEFPPGVPEVDTGPLVSGTFTSARRNGARTAWSVSYPPGRGDAPLPVLIALHGRSGTHTGAFGTSLYLDRFLADAVQHGTAPFAIASVDGGDHSYWHPRRDGDVAAMLLDKFLPLLTSRGLKTDRIALLGWSMGGYGALYLAGLWGRGRVVAAVARARPSGIPQAKARRARSTTRRISTPTPSSDGCHCWPASRCASTAATVMASHRSPATCALR